MTERVKAAEAVVAALQSSGFPFQTVVAHAPAMCEILSGGSRSSARIGYSIRALTFRSRRYDERRISDEAMKVYAPDSDHVVDVIGSYLEKRKHAVRLRKDLDERTAEKIVQWATAARERLAARRDKRHRAIHGTNS